MAADGGMTSEADETPAALTGPGPLTAGERLQAALAALLPLPVVALVLVPVAAVTGASAGEVVGGAVVYGGLLGLAAGFVMVDRLHARQCPRCHVRGGRGEQRCHACGYDLLERPRWACAQRHRVYVEGGLCACGRRLRRLEVARGVGGEVALALKVGAWLLVFLIAMGVLLRVLGG